MSKQILPGASPMSIVGERSPGVLVLHGFSGSPQSMRSLARAFGDAGFHVEMPLLPGHGTSLDDMDKTGWQDWFDGADKAYRRLQERTDKIVVAGLSMGGTLALELALAHPEIAGLVLVNPLVEVMDKTARPHLEALLDQGTERLPSVGSDIADPHIQEQAYAGTPVRPQLSLVAHTESLVERVGGLICPMLVMVSDVDHMVDPESSNVLDTSPAPIERVRLARSYHVATLDYDKDEIERRAVEFATRILG